MCLVVFRVILGLQVLQDWLGFLGLAFRERRYQDFSNNDYITAASSTLIHQSHSCIDIFKGFPFRIFLVLVMMLNYYVGKFISLLRFT